MKISINSIGIENFKSFRMEVVKLSPINVIIGSNSTGKTNLLEGIKLAFDVAAYRCPSDYPFIPYWGYSNAVREGDVDKHIGFSFDISIDSFNIKYKSRVTGVGGSLTFLEEIIYLENYLELRREGSRLSVKYDQKFLEKFSTNRVLLDEAARLRTILFEGNLKEENPISRLKPLENFEGLDPSNSIFSTNMGNRIYSSGTLTSILNYELLFLSQTSRDAVSKGDPLIPLVVPTVVDLSDVRRRKPPISPVQILFSLFGGRNYPIRVRSAGRTNMFSSSVIFLRHDSVYGMKKPVPLNCPPEGMLNGERSVIWLFQQFNQNGGRIPERIQMAMEDNFPGWQIVFKITDDGNVVMQIKETDSYGNNRILAPPSLPDGFFKLLLILTAIEMKPAILLIDELENSLHNSMIEYVIDSLRDSSITTVVTTHSPLVINDVELSEIQILQRDANGTSVRIIEKPEELKKKLLDLGITPGDFWLYGEIA